MAKKRKRRATRPVGAPAPPSGPSADVAPRGGANVARRERKEEARKLRRTVTSIGVAAAVVGGITVVRSLSGPNEIPQAALAAADRAGCTDVAHRTNLTPPGDPHLAPGETIEYPDPPATSGKHHASPPNDEPKVFTEPFDETVAVHGLEHGAVFVYHLPQEQGGVAPEVVERLVGVVQGSNATYLAPYPTLSPETALTMVAWNYRWQCPAESDGTPLTPEDAASIVNGFRTGFECTGEAPENGAAPC